MDIYKVVAEVVKLGGDMKFRRVNDKNDMYQLIDAQLDMIARGKYVLTIREMISIHGRHTQYETIK